MWRCRAGPGLQRARRWLVSRCPVLAVAHRARRTAPIGVQLVKDVLSLVNGIGGPTLVSWPGYFTPGAVGGALVFCAGVAGYLGLLSAELAQPARRPTRHSG